jgi:flavodoxin
MTGSKTDKKILVAYFSHSGNTDAVAKQIHEIVGEDLFQIETVKPYSRDHNEAVEQARNEVREASLPKLKTSVENFASYKVIFIGYPNWWSTIPRPVATFLSENDFTGKSIAAFCTHEGSGLGRSIADINRLCPHATLLEGLAIRGNSARNAEHEVTAWLRKIGMI